MDEKEKYERVSAWISVAFIIGSIVALMVGMRLQAILLIASGWFFIGISVGIRHGRNTTLKEILLGGER